MASGCRGAMNRQSRQSPRHRVVHVFTGLLSQVPQGKMWQERATRVSESHRRLLEMGRPPGPLRQQSQGERRRMRRPPSRRVVWSSGRLRCRGSHRGSGSSSKVSPSRIRERLWADLEMINQGCNSLFERMNGAAPLASTATPLRHHRSTGCYTHLVNQQRRMVVGFILHDLQKLAQRTSRKP
jgi:hypothetical protein